MTLPTAKDIRSIPPKTLTDWWPAPFSEAKEARLIATSLGVPICTPRLVGRWGAGRQRPTFVTERGERLVMMRPKVTLPRIHYLWRLPQLHPDHIDHSQWRHSWKFTIEAPLKCIVAAYTEDFQSINEYALFNPRGWLLGEWAHNLVPLDTVTFYFDLHWPTEYRRIP